MNEILPHLTEEQLIEAINNEVMYYKRTSILKRLYMRYGKLHRARELENLMNGELLK
jgi:hypothetical protein